jgi:hypothetical protein
MSATYEVGETVGGDEADNGLLGDLTVEGKGLVEGPVKLDGANLLTGPAITKRTRRDGQRRGTKEGGFIKRSRLWSANAGMDGVLLSEILGEDVDEGEGLGLSVLGSSEEGLVGCCVIAGMRALASHTKT